MITMIFIDATIFLERWSNDAAKAVTENINPEEYCTSVLVLSEVYHKLRNKGATQTFAFIRNMLGSLTIFDYLQQDLFDAMKNPVEININDKIHIAIMKMNNISEIISYDKDFDRDQLIRRLTPEEMMKDI